MGCGMTHEYPTILSDSSVKASAFDPGVLFSDATQQNRFSVGELPVVVESSLSSAEQPSEYKNENLELPGARITREYLPRRRKQLSFWMGPVLGQGAFGKVYQAVETSTGQLLAVKTINMSYADEAQKTEIFREIKLLAALKHQNIVRIYDQFEENNQLYIVMEALKYSLQALTRQFRCLPELLVSKFAYQAASALAFAHSQGIAHCDVKAANLMLSSDGRVKLVDFGSAFQGSVCEGVRGSPYWLAPEILKQPRYDPFKADVWSFGATLIELYSGNPPFSQFKSAPAVLFHLSELQKPPEIPPCSKKMRHFLKKVFQIEPDLRPTMAEILTEPWLTEEENILPPLGVSDEQRISEDDARTSENGENAESSQDDFFILQESMIGSPDKPSMLRINNSTCVENYNEELASKANWGDLISDIAWLCRVHDYEIFF